MPVPASVFIRAVLLPRVVILNQVRMTLRFDLREGGRGGGGEREGGGRREREGGREGGEEREKRGRRKRKQG